MEKLTREKQLSNLRISVDIMLRISLRNNRECIAELNEKWFIETMVTGTKTSCKLPLYRRDYIIAHTHLDSPFPSGRDLITALCCCVEFKTNFHCVISKTRICMYQAIQSLEVLYKKTNNKKQLKKDLLKALKTISTKVESEYKILCEAAGFHVLFIEI